jgi:hypothetical protein
MAHNRTKICSIFGQIESVVADAMAEEGMVHKIERDMIPPSVKWDETGRLAHCALVFDETSEREFDRRVRELRA